MQSSRFGLGRLHLISSLNLFSCNETEKKDEGHISFLMFVLDIKLRNKLELSIMTTALVSKII